MTSISTLIEDDGEDELRPRRERDEDEQDDLQAVISRMIDAAVDFVEGELAEARQKASEYYMGEPFGNEEEGRSQVVLTEVRDTVNAIMPSLLRVFWGAETPVEFRPEGPEDVDGAEQATDYISKIVLVQDNPGFLIFHSWFKDALVRKLAGVRWSWEESEESETHTVSGVMDDELEMLATDESVEILGITPAGFMPAPAPPPQIGPDGQPMMVPPPPPVPLYDVQFRRTFTRGRVRLVAIPPEELIHNPDARSLDTATLIGHRTEKTKSELLQMGISAEDIEEYGGPSEDLNDGIEHSIRNPFDTGEDDATGDPANDKIEYIECFVLIGRKLANGEADEDDEDDEEADVAELRRICTLGPSRHIVLNEPANDRPFALLCPNPEPHTLVGLSAADDVLDLQLLGSNVIRSMLDSLAQSIFPRMSYVEGQVSAADIHSTAIGAPIRTLQPGMVQPIIVPFVGKEAMPVLDYIDGIKEKRTGISKASVGLDADALQSSTRAAVVATVMAAQQKIEMIARIFAETGVKDLFRGLLRLITEHQDKPRTVRLRGKWVAVDPRSWNANMDVSVNVALGSGLVESKVETLGAVAAKQEMLLSTLGPSNPLVSLPQLRHTYQRVLELQGWKDVDQFFKPIDPNWQPPPPQPPPPDPNMVIAQAEVAKAQAEVAKKQAEMASREQELRMQFETDQAKLALEAQKLQLQQDLERDKLEADVALRAREIEAKYKTEVDIALIRADMERAREERGSRKRRVKTSRDSEGKLTAEIEEVEE